MHVRNSLKIEWNHAYGILAFVRNRWGALTAQGLGFVDTRIVR